MAIGLFIFAYLTVLVCPLFLVHRIVFQCVTNKKASPCEVSLSMLREMFTGLKFVTPDYCSAFTYKESLKLIYRYCERLKKENLKKFITYSNHLNLCLSVLLSIVPLICKTDGNVFVFVKYVIWVRIVSRFIEIVISFGQDVVTSRGESKCSALNKFDRVQLALLSLLEICIISASNYAVINGETCPVQMFNSLLYSIGTSLIVAVNLKGQESNISFASSDNSLFNCFVILQVFTSATLIVLAIAGYLSDDRQQYNSRKNSKYFYGDGDGI